MYRKTIVILYGQMGSGKSRVGSQLLQLGGNWKFFEGDSLLPWYNKLFGFLCKDVYSWPWWLCFVSFFVKYLSVEYFLTGRFLKGVIRNAIKNSCTVVAQALYFKSHRVWLARQLRKSGFRVLYVHVKTSVEQQHQQLETRRFGFFWKWYAKLNDVHFEPGDDDIIFENSPTTFDSDLRKLNQILLV